MNMFCQEKSKQYLKILKIFSKYLFICVQNMFKQQNYVIIALLDVIKLSIFSYLSTQTAIIFECLLFLCRQNINKSYLRP
jgi:hypothetical protein